MERPLWEQLDELGEYRQLGRVRTDHVVRVREPMVLVSQIQRSGGTLLSRLFDGHPECHAHPYELKIGHKAALAEARPECARVLVRGALRAQGRAAPRLRLEQAGAEGDRGGRLPVPLPAAAAEAALRRVHRGGNGRAPARGARRLLHGVLQRLGRQPEPLLGAEEARDGLHAADEPRSEERQAVLPRLPRWLAGDDRPGAARLVRVGVTAPHRVPRPRRRARALARLRDARRSRSASATATASSSSPTRSW